MEFHCQSCGLCCCAEENEETLGVRMFDFEAREIKKQADQNGFHIQLIPALTLSDKQSRKELIIMYKLEHKNCPFHINNKCIIYEYRPLVCRAFPIITTGRFSQGQIVRSGLCNGNILLKSKEIENYPKQDNDVLKTYGECYLYCLFFEETLHTIKTNVQKLIQTGEIIPEPAKGKYCLQDITNQLPHLIEVSIILQEIQTLQNTKQRFKIN